MIHRMLIPTLAALLVASLALATPASAAESKIDKAILEAGVVTKADVPASWTSSKSSNSDRAFKVPECKKIRAAVDSAKRKAPRVQSRRFEDPAKGGTAFADSLVYAFSDVKAATKFLSAYQSPDAPTCFQAGIAKALTGAQSAGQPTVGPIPDLQGVGDAAVGDQITIPFTSGKQTASLDLDFVIVRVGRAVIGFRFSNVDARFPEGPGIVQMVVQRVASAEA